MKIFNATCSGSVVTVNSRVVPNCPIMGEGGSSSGYVVMAENKLFYLPKTTPDVKTFLTQIENLCGKLETLCDTIAAITVTCATAGNPSSPPINAASFATAKEDIAAVHSNLTTLKGALK